nr:MAG TPA_asm: hypothetical protein [Caudoviricetes sp.]
MAIPVGGVESLQLLSGQRAWGFVQKVAVSNRVITPNEKRGE